MKRVYIAAPLRGATPEETEQNRRQASKLMAFIAKTEKVAITSTWPLLAEHWSEEEGRELGLKIDCAVIEVSDELWQCGPVQPLSEGMAMERAHAEKHGVLVVDKRGVYETLMGGVTPILSANERALVCVNEALLALDFDIESHSADDTLFDVAHELHGVRLELGAAAWPETKLVSDEARMAWLNARATVQCRAGVL